MTTRKDESQPTSRRCVLQLIGVGGGLAIGTGIATGSGNGVSPKPDSHDVHEGDATSIDDGELTAYATTNSAGKLSSLGVHMDSAAFTAFDRGGDPRDEKFEAHLHLPDETTSGGRLDTHQFTFVGFHYNPEGHPPPGVYTVPHFDFHFYMMDERDVNEIPLGVAAYEVPPEQFPAEYGHGDPRVIEPRMGEHLLDRTSPEVAEQNQELFTHTNIYGAYDPSIDPDDPVDTTTLPLGPDGDQREVPVFEGDGEGEIHFVEPMITNAFIRDDLEEAVVAEIGTPDRFAAADDYPTEYAIQPDGEGGVYVSIDGFEEFPGPSG